MIAAAKNAAAKNAVENWQKIIRQAAETPAATSATAGRAAVAPEKAKQILNQLLNTDE